MVHCPACLPPNNDGCATCGGSWNVSQEVSNDFLQLQAKRNAAFELATMIYERISIARTVEEIRSVVIEIVEQVAIDK